MEKADTECHVNQQNRQQILEQKEKVKEQVSHCQFQVTSVHKDLKNKADKIDFFNQSLKEITHKEHVWSKKSDQNQQFIKDNQSGLSKVESLLTNKQKEYEKILANQNTLQSEYQSQLSQYKELEVQITELNQKSGSTAEQRHQIEIELESLYADKRTIEEKAFENYQIELANTSLQQLQKDVEEIPEESRENLSQFKNQLSGIGQVNLLALSEYEALSKENNELQKQFDDLTQSKKDLEKVIDEMNKVSTKKFNKAFEDVNLRLGQVFSSVFGGGKASLTLVEEGTDSQKGVEILVSPPGKKLKNLKLLSGGEKALTALSMIFSLFLVRPAPFCLLDEVDAALDDSNTIRFNSLMIEMAKKCQVILITHNKHSMKECDRLYGVTMEEKGITQLLSVDVKTHEHSLSLHGS